MDPDAKLGLAHLYEDRERFRNSLAALEEQTSELRLAAISQGVDPYLLKEFECSVVEHAVHDLLRRNADERIKNVEAAIAEDENSKD